MTCRDVYHDVLELARGGREAAGATDARAHLATCASCRERFGQQQALTAGLRAMAAASRAAEPSVDLDRRVMLASTELAISPDRATIVGGEGRPRSPRDRGHLWMQLAAGLAAVAVAASWWAFRGSERNMPASTLNSRAIAPLQGRVVPTPVATPVGRSAGLPPTSDPTERSASKADPTRQQPRLLSPEGFVSLPSAAGLPDFERGEILRLEIAVAALPNYGVEIPPDAEDRPIEIDLLVGQDGHPRAIRLVNVKAQMRYVDTNR